MITSNKVETFQDQFKLKGWRAILIFEHLHNIKIQPDFFARNSYDYKALFIHLGLTLVN